MALVVFLCVRFCRKHFFLFFFLESTSYSFALILNIVVTEKSGFSTEKNLTHKQYTKILKKYFWEVGQGVSLIFFLFVSNKHVLFEQKKKKKQSMWLLTY